jgi:hypothetical protein
LFYVRFYDSELHLSLCALEVVASGIDDIIVQTIWVINPLKLGGEAFAVQFKPLGFGGKI